MTKNNNEKNENLDDTDDLYATSVLERLTDSSYDEEKTAEKKDNSDFTETSVFEKLTDERYDNRPQEPQKKPEKKSPKKDVPTATAASEVLSFIRDLAICVVAVFLLTSFVIRPVQVKGNSMYPELNDGAVGFSNVIGYNTTGLKRFDIVIIYVAEKDEYLVKRVIGLPGETVAYKDGQLFINDQIVKEDFLDKDYVSSYNGTFMADVASIKLGDDEYYCLGDNRPHSSDSRYYGPFKKENIKSKGIFIFYPFNQFGVATW
jgi:signal peptidase I